jgi:hypothetical protein
VLCQDIEDRVSQDIQDTHGAPPAAVIWLVRRLRDAESQAGHHRRHCREASGQRGGEVLRRRPLLGLRAARPLQGRGRVSVRAAVPAAEDLPSAISDDAADLITRLRKELSGQRLDAGPQTIAWHLEHRHQVNVSAATVSRYLSRAGLVTPP